MGERHFTILQVHGADSRHAVDILRVGNEIHGVCRVVVGHVTRTGDVTEFLDGLTVTSRGAHAVEPHVEVVIDAHHVKRAANEGTRSGFRLGISAHAGNCRWVIGSETDHCWRRCRQHGVAVDRLLA